MSTTLNGDVNWRGVVAIINGQNAHEYSLKITLWPSNDLRVVDPMDFFVLRF